MATAPAWSSNCFPDFLWEVHRQEKSFSCQLATDAIILPVMTEDLLKKYESLKSALQKEKAALENRLAAINEVLGLKEGEKAIPSPGRLKTRGRKRAVGRRNEGKKKSVRAEIAEILASGPKSKEEIFSELRRRGVTFRENSTSVLLYSKKHFKRLGQGKFGNA